MKTKKRKCHVCDGRGFYYRQDEDNGYRVECTNCKASVEEDGDEIATDMPKHCTQFRCNKAKLYVDKGFWVCPNCGGSYGKAANL